MLHHIAYKNYVDISIPIFASTSDILTLKNLLSHCKIKWYAHMRILKADFCASKRRYMHWHFLNNNWISPSANLYISEIYISHRNAIKENLLSGIHPNLIKCNVTWNLIKFCVSVLYIAIVKFVKKLYSSVTGYMIY